MTPPADKTILIVEDEALIRLSVTETLESAGFQVIAAANAEAALEALGDQPEVNVVFTDINMPGKMDGLDLAQFIHAKWPRIALMVTSGKMPPSVAKDLPAGSQFFSKPYSYAELIEAIRKKTST